MSTSSRSEALSPWHALSALPGVGPVRSAQLADAGLRSIGDLLAHVPLRYEDRRRVHALAEVTTAGAYSLKGRVVNLKTIRLRKRRLTMVRGRFLTDGAELPVVWFNRPYLESQMTENVELLLHGSLRRRSDGWELVNPTVEPAESPALAGRIVPVYGALGALGPSLVRKMLGTACRLLDWSGVHDPLPEPLLDSRDLPSLSAALSYLHVPPDTANVHDLNERATRCHHRLVYGELLRAQLELAMARRAIRSRAKLHRYGDVLEPLRVCIRALPFVLTAGQERALSEILSDLHSPSPMMRLLQGDVGCGKTVVAALALAAAAASGLQAALMVPTELLAEQHVRALGAVLGSAYPMELLMSSAADLEESKERIATGESLLAVGTHALFQESVAFARLGLVIVDEQHRFGVAQRRALQLKGETPDLLVMTATPIPRSLTLAVYGDLSVSVIDELPAGRRPVTTRIAVQRDRDEVYDWVAEQLAAGARAYVVLPLIEESKSVAAESIAGLGRELEERFSDFNPAVIHGRTDPDQRAARMRAFAAGTSRMMIATTLIEVGVDVSEATIMVIESAERFGLAQLHQLRGRVGRGGAESHCFALYGTASEGARRRLEIFSSTSDGFELSEADLALRGPGDLLGTRQSGVPSFGFADLVRHREWIEKARDDARRLVAEEHETAMKLAGQATFGSRDPLAGG